MRKKTNGFTMIEVIIVTVILGILATAVLANFKTSLFRSRDGRRKADLNQVKTALRMFYNDQNSYSTVSLSWGEIFTKPGVPDVVYMKRLPVDPLTNLGYGYYATNCDDANNDYRLVATFENTIDPDIARSHLRCPDDCGYTWSAGQYVVCAD